MYNQQQFITMTSTEWCKQAHTAHYEILRSAHPLVDSHIEIHTFRPGFRLVRQRFISRQPVWHPAFSDIDYIGFCFAFCAANPADMALSHLFHPRMNITSGYRFDGGVNRVTDTPLTYVSLQFSREFLLDLADGQILPSWLGHLLQERGVIDSIATPYALRERAWQIGQLPLAATLSHRLHIEALSLDWLADSLQFNQTAKVNNRMDEVIDIIVNEYQNPLTISELAQRVGINVCYLKQQFKAHTGVTINTFITQTRLNIAKNLLRERPELSINLVASLCGYQGSYFSAIFKKYHGISPRQWQSQYVKK